MLTRGGDVMVRPRQTSGTTTSCHLDTFRPAVAASVFGNVTAFPQVKFHRHAKKSTV
jgi:hypothetical protein